MEKKDEIYGFQTLYREVGYYVSRLEQYERSLKFFDQALSKFPNDKRALIGRSRARAKAIHYEGALEDINKALKLEPTDLLVLADKALNTYLLCEFEEGLVQNSRLCPLRQQPENFLLGIMHCSDAIENCVGERTGRPLRDHFKIIRKLAWHRNAEAQKPFQPRPQKKKKKKRKKPIRPQAEMKEALKPNKRMSVKPLERKRALSKTGSLLSIKDSLHSKDEAINYVPPLAQPFPYRPLQNYTTNIENYMAEKYLDSMYLDKIFLQKIQATAGTNCPNKKGSRKIKQIAKNGFKTVAYKQEMMRTRRPFYFIKYHEAISSGALQMRQARELELQQHNAKVEADNILKKLYAAYNEKKLKTILDVGEKLKYYCDSKSRKLLPDKDMYLKEIYDKIAKGFFDMYRISDQQSRVEQENRVCILFGVQPISEYSTDSVLDEVKSIVVDNKKQLEVFEQRLTEAQCPEEVCWCYHELARYHMELRKFEMARVYARKCIREGEIVKNHHWMLNSIMLMVRCNLQQHNKSDAKNDIKAAQKLARHFKDERLDKYLNLCHSIFDVVELDDLFGPKLLEKREKKIISMMSTGEMKDEIAHLFRQMSAMPSSRRLTIMPGVINTDEPKKTRKSSRKMSIMPSRKIKSEIDLDDLSNAKQQRKSGGGLQFLNLMQ